MNRRMLLGRGLLAGATLLAAPLLSLVPRVQVHGPRLHRAVEIYDKGTWRPGTWATVKKDDIFRLRNPDGSIVNEGTEHEICVAMSDAILQPKPYFSVEGEPFTFIGMDHPLAGRVRVIRNGEPIGKVQWADLRSNFALVDHRAGDHREDGFNMFFLENTRFDYVELGPEKGTSEYVSEMAELHRKLTVPA